jgi:hypothetical protein
MVPFLQPQFVILFQNKEMLLDPTTTNEYAEDFKPTADRAVASHADAYARKLYRDHLPTHVLVQVTC